VHVPVRGYLLSVCRKQRIAIARAMVRKPKILLLDEATSALDENSQELVQERVQAKMRKLGGTTVMIAHRQTTFMKATCIACFVHGEVVEYATSADGEEHGAHDQLMKQRGEYYALFTGSSANKDASVVTTEAEKKLGEAVASDLAGVGEIKLERQLSKEDEELRKQLSAQAKVATMEQTDMLAMAPKESCCCNGPQRVVSMLGPLRWTLPCCVFFSALYGTAIPGLMITVRTGRCTSSGNRARVDRTNSNLLSI
jgi:ABC-type methionine transport system ATPase subunit